MWKQPEIRSVAGVCGILTASKGGEIVRQQPFELCVCHREAILWLASEADECCGDVIRGDIEFPRRSVVGAIKADYGLIDPIELRESRPGRVDPIELVVRKQYSEADRPSSSGRNAARA